jgi:hypothetical protein
MQSEHNVNGRRELSLDENAANLRRKRSVAELSPVDSTKYDESARKNLISMLQQEIEGWAEDADYHVDFLVGILVAKEGSQSSIIIPGIEPGEVHSFAINLELLGGAGSQRPREFRVDSRQARQLLTLVKKQHDVAARRHRRQYAGDPHGQNDSRTSQVAAKSSHSNPIETRLLMTSPERSFVLALVQYKSSH